MKNKKSERKTYAKPRTLVAEVDGVKYTMRTVCNYRYFWVCDAILPNGSIQKNAYSGWSGRKVNMDGMRTAWVCTNTRCVPVASDPGETTVEKEKETPAQPRMDELKNENNRALVGLGLFICYCTALENNATEDMKRILKKLDEVGLTIVKTSDGKYSLMEKEEK